MLITKIESGKNKRYRVFGDDTFLFALYKNELKRYQIEENVIIEDSVISSILDEIIYKRAKERALYLLERRPLTVSMLRGKLRYHDYPEQVVEKVIQFLEKYHYLDDMEYIRMYAGTYSDKKSKKQIIYDLMCKGISKSLIEIYFEENAYSEQKGFEKQFERYVRGKDLGNLAVRQKVFRYFYGKGFAVSLIETALRNRTELED